MINKNTLDKLAKTGIKQVKKTRKWTRKKSGQQVTREYLYSSSKLLFRKTKYGYKLIDSAWKEFEESIRKLASSEAESQSLINEARTIRDDILHNERIYSSKRQKGRNRIDVKSMASRLAANIAVKYLYNMGLSPADVIEYVKQKTGLTILEIDLINPGKWNDDVWSGNATDGTALNLKIEFNYNGVEGITIQKLG